MRLSDKLLRGNLTETPYQRVAKEFGVTALFVGMIARGERKPIRGKGLQIKHRLETMAEELTIKKESNEPANVAGC